MKSPLHKVQAGVVNSYIHGFNEDSGKMSCVWRGSDSDGRMIRGGFLIEEDRKALIALARDGLAAGRVTRRANALVLLDKGMSCQQVAEVFLFDDDTIRGWYELFEQSGVEGLSHFDVGGSSSKMTPLQCGALKAWVGATLPRSTRHIGAWIAKEFGLV